MVSYTFDLALVKYYRESLDEYATFMPFKIANTKDQAFYAKISIINQGNLLWNLDDGAGNLVTEKTYTVNANSVLDLNEKLIASTAPTETQKDTITILVEYFKDSGLTQKFGEDTITANIHCYIQQADGSWTSTAYPNEADIVYDKWNFSGLALTNIADGTRLTGVNGLADLYFKLISSGGGVATYVSDVGLVTDASLKITVQGNKSYGYRKLWIYPMNAGTTNIINDKFFSAIVNVTAYNIYDASKWRLYIKALYSTSLDDTDASRYFMILQAVTIRKVIFLPFQNLNPAIFQYAYADYDTTISIVAQYDGAYVFNKLP
ncbi:hypothetical protein [Thermococcus barophilus]|uniref:Uncharacterized protein n=1 Tax=Thermococcus barophilus TaxID=55802 RepID=A0A0S1XF85_THEBA|nr:hypothetical protein [Thermococcus barophilus]ALM76460.1 hypothetical protein TBCH5v1_2571 [Thermococcus barophilus]